MDALGYTQLPAGYEPLAGYRLYRVVDHHPIGPYVAMEAIGQARLPAAAVWDTQTGRLVYAPQAASLIGWHGATVLVVGYSDEFGNRLNALPRNVLCSYWFERRTWPQDELIGSCDVAFNTGWPHSLVWSPAGNLAVIRTQDQEMSGWDFVVLAAAGTTQVASAGFSMDRYAALASQPAYSPDGRYAVSGYHTTFTEQVGRSDIPEGIELPLKQGRFEVGRITVVDIDEAISHEITIADAVPAALHQAAATRLDRPIFVDSEHFRVTFPTGEQRTYSVRQ